MSDEPPSRPGAGIADDVEPDEATVDHVELMTFPAGDRTYGIELDRVDQLVDDYDVERLPRTGPAVEGVTHVGGDVIAVVNLAELFGIDPGASDSPGQLIALSRDGDQQAVGVEVPAPGEIASVPMASLEPIDDGSGVDEPPRDRTVFAVAMADESRPPIHVLDVNRLIEAALAEDG